MANASTIEHHEVIEYDDDARADEGLQNLEVPDDTKSFDVVVKTQEVGVTRSRTQAPPKVSHLIFSVPSGTGLRIIGANTERDRVRVESDTALVYSTVPTGMTGVYASGVPSGTNGFITTKIDTAYNGELHVFNHTAAAVLISLWAEFHYAE